MWYDGGQGWQDSDQVSGKVTNFARRGIPEKAVEVGMDISQNKPGA